MIEASKLRAGMTFVTADGKLIKVLEASHHKPGKGNTVMRMKLRDVRSGSTFDTTYRPEEKFEQAIIETRAAQYLYKMDDTAYFMDTESYEQYEIPVANVEQELFYILENSEVKIQFYGTEVIGVTVHNTDWISVASGTTPAEQYTRATVNGNMKDVRVHYYVDNVCVWQNLPLSLSGWHAADGSGNGNRKTIAIECIMSSAYNSTDKKSEDNCARLAAALLKKYGLDINHLYTHTHWLNVRDGKSGTVDYLNTTRNPYKMCPAYILTHWAEFKKKVQAYMNVGSSTPTTSSPKQLYRVRKSWSDAKSQIGAFSSLENAKKACKAGYAVFDSNGKQVYPTKKSIGEVAREVIQGKWGCGCPVDTSRKARSTDRSDS